MSETTGCPECGVGISHDSSCCKDFKKLLADERARIIQIIRDLPCGMTGSHLAADGTVKDTWEYVCRLQLIKILEEL